MDLARFIASRFGPSLHAPCRLTSTDPEGRTVRMGKDELGRLGEDLAAAWLKRRSGWRVLYRNYRSKHGGEVDIVARDRQTLVFVEVKTRSSAEFGHPSDAVDEEKQRLIVRGALDWLRRLGQPKIHYRFDIVEVIARDGKVPELNLIENAFHSGDAYYY